jgi:hypothetical protein
MADNDIQQAIRSLANTHPNLDPAILDQIASLYNPASGKVEWNQNDVMSDEDLDNVIGGSGATLSYKSAVSSLASNPALNQNVISQIARLNIRACW